MKCNLACMKHHTLRTPQLNFVCTSWLLLHRFRSWDSCSWPGPPSEHHQHQLLRLCPSTGRQASIMSISRFGAERTQETTRISCSGGVLAWLSLLLPLPLPLSSSLVVAVWFLLFDFFWYWCSGSCRCSSCSCASRDQMDQRTVGP